MKKAQVLRKLQIPGASITTPEACVLFGVSRNVARNWARRGKFGAYQTEKKHGRGYQWAFQGWLVKRELERQQRG